MSENVKCPNCGANYGVTITPQQPTADSNYLWIFDNGHGGIIDGVYQSLVSMFQSMQMALMMNLQMAGLCILLKVKLNLIK